ncbi:MAG: hypothetical protein AB7V46_06525 [Thermomicrobiales bacterium]
MIAISFFLFAVLLVVWMVIPGGESKASVEVENPLLAPESQSV